MHDTRQTQVVAHRGASGLAPELTLAACELALDFGADFIELDVRMSRDGELVIIHDRQLERTTNGRGPVHEKTLAQLKELDAGSWFNRAFPHKARPAFACQKIPALQEVVELISDSAAGLYLEIKDPGLYPPDLESKILSVIRSGRFTERITLLSFDTRSLEKVKGLDPDMRTALLINDRHCDPVESAVAAGSAELALHYTLLTDALAVRATAAGLCLSVWTVDEEKDMKRMIQSGVGSITTNYPDRLIGLLDS